MTVELGRESFGIVFNGLHACSHYLLYDIYINIFLVFVNIFEKNQLIWRGISQFDMGKIK